MMKTLSEAELFPFNKEHFKSQNKSLNPFLVGYQGYRKVKGREDGNTLVDRKLRNARLDNQVTPGGGGGV